jgi:hypothetical protein
MATKYNAPDNANFAYDLSRAEINARGNVYTAISNIKHNQKLEEGVVRGTKAGVLKRTRGALGMGEGEIEFSDFEEAVKLVEDFGDGWGEVIFPVVIVWTAPNKPSIKEELFACRFLDLTLDHKEGADAQTGNFPFSFMERKINGKKMLLT